MKVYHITSDDLHVIDGGLQELYRLIFDDLKNNPESAVISDIEKTLERINNVISDVFQE